MRRFFLSLLAHITHFGSDPDDSDEVRVHKTLLVTGSLFVIVATAAYGLVYLAFGEKFAGVIPLFYAAVSIASVTFFGLTRRYHFFRFSQLLLGMILPPLLMLALGGFANSSAVILWSLIPPIGALLLYEHRPAMGWWLAYLIVLVISGLLEPALRFENNIPPGLVTAFFILNLGSVSGIVLFALVFFLRQKDAALERLRIEEQKAENLLLNILPREIAAILKNENRTIADHFAGASILFADLVDFTPLTAELTPVAMVNLLNEIFSHFDSLVEKYDLEKIRTIGDNYMVASGVPRPRTDHADAIARLALDMSAYIENRPPHDGRRITFRIGINSGPVVGGVIGRKKFVYDLWGDAVNIASRMESQGMPGRIQITRATHELIHERFICERRGQLSVKGRGEMETWFLLAENREYQGSLQEEPA